MNDWTSPDGTIRLIHGDARQVLPELDLDGHFALVTDPPYGISHETHGQIFRKAESIDNDHDCSMIEWLDQWCGTNALVSFYSPYNPPKVKWRSVLVWDKGAHVGIGGDRRTCWKRDAELIGVKNNKPLNGKRDSCVLRFPALSPPPTGHFCEKPVPLMTYLLKKLKEDVIVDPFTGSGSCAVAAYRTHKTFIGIESSPRWFQVACKRMEDELDKESFLSGMRQTELL